MLSWMKPRKAEASPASVLLELERDVARLSGPQAMPSLLRLASVQAQAGLTTRAVANYTRALDVLIPDGRIRAALVVCGKILDISPHMLRPRCTLTWLELGGVRPSHEVEALIVAYAEAAYLAGRGHLATVQLAWMEEVVAEASLRFAIAAGLLACDAPHAADRILGSVYAELNGVYPRREPRPDVWMSRMIEAVALSAIQVEAQGERGEAPHAPDPELARPSRKSSRRMTRASG